mmetsp:Transcript_15494/g.60594  ORF Transcript_15494/g.60594 Transcript_15494/m.60594 type:complete len:1061 (-) Transcript_15494:28-3210(-)
MLEALPVPIGGAFPNSTADTMQGREQTRAELQAELQAARAEAAQYGAMAMQCQAMIEDTMKALESTVSQEAHAAALAAAERRVREEERDKFDAEREAVNQMREQQQNEYNAQITQLAEHMQLQEQMMEHLQAQLAQAQANPPADAAQGTPAPPAPADEEVRQELELHKTKLRVAEERLSAVEQDLAAAMEEKEERSKELMQAQSKAKLLSKMHDAFKGKSIEEAKRNQATIASLERRLAGTPPVSTTAEAEPRTNIESSEQYQEALARAMEAEARAQGLEQQLAAVDAQAADSQSALETANRKAAEAADAAEAAKQQLERVAEEKMQLEAEVARQQAGLAAQEQALKFATKAAEQLSSAGEEKDGEDGATRAELQVRLEKLEEENTTLLAKVEESTLAAAASAEHAAAAASAEHATALQKAEEEVERLRAKVEDVSRELADTKESLDALESQSRSAADNSSQLAESILETRAQLQTVLDEKNAAEAALQQSKAALAALVDQVATMQEEAAGLRSTKAAAQDALEQLQAAGAMKEAASSESSQIVEEIYAKHRLERQRYETELTESQQQCTRLKGQLAEMKARADELNASAVEFSSVAQLATKKLDQEQQASLALREQVAELEAAIAEKVRLLAEEADRVVDLQQQLAQAQLEASLASDAAEEAARKTEGAEEAAQTASKTAAELKATLEKREKQLADARAELAQAKSQALEETRRAAEQQGRLQGEVDALRGQLESERESGSASATEQVSQLSKQLSAANEAIFALEAEAANVRKQKDDLEDEAKRLRSEMVAQIETHRCTKEELQAQLARSEKQVVENLREQRASLVAFQERYEEVDRQLDVVAGQLEIARVTAERLEAAQAKFMQLEQMFADERRQHEETAKQVGLERKRVEIAKELTCDLQRHIIEITNAHNDSLDQVARLEEELDEARAALERERGAFEEEKTSILYDFLHRQYGGSSSLSPTGASLSASSSRSHSRRPSHGQLPIEQANGGTSSEQKQQQAVARFQHHVDERAALAHVKRRLVDELWSHSMELTASASKPASTSAHSLGRSNRRG